jgi:lipid-A-disaccharide synthase
MIAGTEQAISTMPDIRRIVVTRAPGIDAELYERLCAGHELVTLTSDTYGAVRGARAAVVNSGTATLETALLDCPETAVYHLKFGRLLGLLRPIMFQIPYFTLVNIITGRQVIRELLMYEFTVESVRDELYRLLTDKQYLAAMRQGYNELIQILGTSPAARTAAALITRGA